MAKNCLCRSWKKLCYEGFYGRLSTIPLSVQEVHEQRETGWEKQHLIVFVDG